MAGHARLGMDTRVSAGVIWALLWLWPAAGLAAPSDGRFSLVLSGAAVKDNQTGLIWEQEPDRDHDVWSRSNQRCAAKEVGGQKGWRGPSVEELKTLIDPTQRDPALATPSRTSNPKSIGRARPTPKTTSWPGKSVSSVVSRSPIKSPAPDACGVSWMSGDKQLQLGAFILTV